MHIVEIDRFHIVVLLSVKVQFAFMVIFQGHVFHVPDVLLVDSECPPQEAQEETEEDAERNDRPDRDVGDTAEDVLIHGLLIYRSAVFSALISFPSRCR